MTRRHFLAMPWLGMAVPAVGAPVESNGFIVSGVLQQDSDIGYYALEGESVAFMLDPDRVPSMVRAADALVGKPVELVLRRVRP